MNRTQTTRKQVRFGTSSMTTVDTVPETIKSQIWYNGQELQELNIQEVSQTQYLYQLNRKCKTSLELAELSWRGIENVQKGYSREENTTQYARNVVTEYKAQIKAFGDCDPEDLRAVAKAHSKKDRVKARKMGLKDAEQTRKERTGKNNVKPLERLARGIGREMSLFKVARGQHRVSALPTVINKAA